MAELGEYKVVEETSGARTSRRFGNLRGLLGAGALSTAVVLLASSCSSDQAPPPQQTTAASSEAAPLPTPTPSPADTCAPNGGITLFNLTSDEITEILAHDQTELACIKESVGNVSGEEVATAMSYGDGFFATNEGKAIADTAELTQILALALGVYPDVAADRIFKGKPGDDPIGIGATVLVALDIEVPPSQSPTTQLASTPAAA